MLVRDLRLDLSSGFTPDLQDRLAIVLLKRAGLTAFEDGRAKPAEFQDAVAKVWAGLPMQDGKSAYDGLAGNRAVITRTEYDTAFQKIFPERF